MAKTKTRIDFRSLEIPAVAQKPLYAGVGAGDLAVTAVKEYVADVQQRLTGVQKSVSDLDAKKLRASVESRVAELQSDAKALPNNVAATVTSTYADLAKRGEARVKGTKLPSSASVEVKVNTTNPAARKTTAKKAPAKKSTAKKSTAKKTASTNA